MDLVGRALSELADPNALTFIRRLAVSNLARSGDARVIPALEAAARGDLDAEVREAAANALAVLRPARPEPSTAPAAELAAVPPAGPRADLRPR